MSKTDDLINISRVLLQNDKNAFEPLVKKYQSPLHRYLLYLTGNSSLSDDIAQETFIKAYLNLGSFKGIAGFKTWLFRIAYNLWFNHLRSDKNSEKPDILLSLPDETSNVSTFDSSLDIRNALNNLKPEEKSALTLFYLQEMSVKEIAKVMRMPQGTVKSHLSRGRENMKKHLNG